MYTYLKKVVVFVYDNLATTLAPHENNRISHNVIVLTMKHGKLLVCLCE